MWPRSNSPAARFPTPIELASPRSCRISGGSGTVSCENRKSLPEPMPRMTDRIGLFRTMGFLAFGGNLRRMTLRGELSRHRKRRTTVALPNNGGFRVTSLSDRCLTSTSHSSHFVCVCWKRSADSLGVHARHGCKQTTTGIARHRKFKPCHSDQPRLSV